MGKDPKNKPRTLQERGKGALYFMYGVRNLLCCRNLQKSRKMRIRAAQVSLSAFFAIPGFDVAPPKLHFTLPPWGPIQSVCEGAQNKEEREPYISVTWYHPCFLAGISQKAADPKCAQHSIHSGAIWQKYQEGLTMDTLSHS